jgi:hypothetical protein
MFKILFTNIVPFTRLMWKHGRNSQATDGNIILRMLFARLRNNREYRHTLILNSTRESTVTSTPTRQQRGIPFELRRLKLK